MPQSRGATALRANAASIGFDLALAHDLYRRLLDPVEDGMTGVDHLIVVSGDDALAGLPLQLLVTRPPDASLDGAEALRRAHWLLRDVAVSSLPSVSSLRALRALSAAAPVAEKPFLGVGDPVVGSAGPMVCPEHDPTATEGVAVVPAVVSVPYLADGFFVRSAVGVDTPIADVAAVRSLSRLADTRCELQRIAASLGAGDLLLADAATETELKHMDETGALDDYRVMAFATHGLTAGSVGGVEPALVLTPPAEASTLDDGLLTAGEIAALRLNAEWVILSACNTAAGQQQGGESLSGLARAFFYAGSRTLLVSHWPVVSTAAVRITTSALARLQARPGLRRAEAVRQAVLAIIDDQRSGPFELHPRYWGAFSLVGEGGSG